MKQILAPLPGVFYRRSSPSEPVLVNEGTALAAGTSIGLIEAMKSFFPVEAEEASVLVRFLVENGDAVDADQPIAEVE
ncbi:acetyl-CoA carboxylase [Gemmobacter fulvus]|uniref:acetyl-CoA carboxylase n=1 Tax=Gemmobacter fulvus TaxID=2840474 RepID=UPI002796CDD6|nr:acetyl-CoA carboxylase [Gemmobacter fulvus]MDQ1850605.1 acetyl-CoA carboxylase [Gemmobacter fulvus]